MKWPWRIGATVGFLLFVLLSVFPKAGIGPSLTGLHRVFDLTPQKVAGGGNVVVFVVDSPVDGRFLEGRMLDMKGSDVTHGSLVARVIRSYCRALLVSVPAEDPSGAFDRKAYLSGLRQILRYARNRRGVRVLVNVSLGTYERDAEEEDLVRRLAQAGALVVAAAGNDDTDRPMYPAAYRETVAVANATRQGKTLASNYGPHITICAPGDISFIDYEFLPYERLRREMEARGTSFAAPKLTATLAYVLRKRPDVSSREALSLVTAAATPIEDDHFADGELGVGLLDIYRAKSSVHPPYKWLHYALPAGLGVILVAFTLFLCLRYTLVGLFISLLVWVVGVPSAVVLTLGAKRYLEFVGTGYRHSGPLPLVVAGATALGCALLLRFNTKNMLRVFLPAAAVGLILGIAQAGAFSRSAALSVVALGATALVEWRARRLLTRLRSLASEETPAEAADYLAAVYERTADERVRRAALESVLQLPLQEAAEHLLHNRAHARGAAALLERIERHMGKREAIRPDDGMSA